MTERKFQGLWFPAALLGYSELNFVQKALILEINSLDKDGKGAFAKDEHYARFLGLSKGRVSNMLTELRKKEIIYTADNNGRKRWLKVSPRFAAEFLHGSRHNEIVNSELIDSGEQVSRKREVNRDTVSNTVSLFSIESEKIKVDKELRKNAMAEYDEFHIREAGLKMRMDGGNGAALNKILYFIWQQIDHDQSLEDQRVEVEAVFSAMLSEKFWSSLPSFHRKNILLRQINSNLEVILKHLKDGNQTATQKQSGEDEFFTLFG